MLKKYISVYACITALAWIGFRLLCTESMLMQFFIIFMILLLPMAYLIMFFIEPDFTVKQKYICCIACIFISLTAYLLSNSVDDAYHAISLSDGLGHAFLHIFFTFYTCIIIPAILLIGTIICHIISHKKKR